MAEYDPDGMNDKKRKEFMTWYQQKVESNATFNFQEELLAYCESDVKLLKEGCLKFVREFKDIAGFHGTKNWIYGTFDTRQKSSQICFWL